VLLVLFSGEISNLLSLLSRVFTESGFKQLLQELLRDTHKAELFVLVLYKCPLKK